MSGTGDLERRVAELEEAVAARAAVNQQLLAQVNNRFAEVAKALDVITASLEQFQEFDDPDQETTGVLGRAFELQAVVTILKVNLAEMQERLGSL